MKWYKEMRYGPHYRDINYYWNLYSQDQTRVGYVWKGQEEIKYKAFFRQWREEDPFICYELDRLRYVREFDDLFSAKNWIERIYRDEEERKTFLVDYFIESDEVF